MREVPGSNPGRAQTNLFRFLEHKTASKGYFSLEILQFGGSVGSGVEGVVGVVGGW